MTRRSTSPRKVMTSVGAMRTQTGGWCEPLAARTS